MRFIAKIRDKREERREKREERRDKKNDQYLKNMCVPNEIFGILILIMIGITVLLSMC